MEFTDSQLKNFLLGKIDEQAEEEIGVQIITDESLEEKLQIAGNDLMEDFLDKNLSSEEEKLFLENFLVCDERRTQLEEISFFKRVSRKKLSAENLIEEDRTESFWEKLKKTIAFDLRFAVPVFAVLIVAVVGFYFLYNADRSSPLEKEYVALNRRDLTNLAEFKDDLNVSLISGTYRDSGSEKKLDSNSLSDKVFFRLALPFETAADETVEADLLKDQKTIFRQTEIRAYQNQSGQEIRLFLPKTVLPKGKYQIKIGNPKAKNSSVTYNFAVE